MQRILTTSLILFAATSCSYEYLDCSVDYLLPGMWSGRVEISNGLAGIDIDAEIHLQLFLDPDDPDGVVGWAYITDGTLDIAGFPSMACYPQPVSGLLTPTENGIYSECLTVGGSDICIEFHGTSEGAEFSASYLLFSEGDYLTDYESLGERALEDFQCLD